MLALALVVVVVAGVAADKGATRTLVLTQIVCVRACVRVCVYVYVCVCVCVCSCLSLFLSLSTSFSLTRPLSTSTSFSLTRPLSLPHSRTCHPWVCFGLKLHAQLFRHGDRSPVADLPLYRETLDHDWPMGLGQLTDRGRAMHFHLGRFFQRHYKDLIKEYNKATVSHRVRVCLDETGRQRRER